MACRARCRTGASLLAANCKVSALTPASVNLPEFLQSHRARRGWGMDAVEPARRMESAADATAVRRAKTVEVGPPSAGGRDTRWAEAPSPSAAQAGGGRTGWLSTAHARAAQEADRCRRTKHRPLGPPPVPAEPTSRNNQRGDGLPARRKAFADQSCLGGWFANQALEAARSLYSCPNLRH